MLADEHPVWLEYEAADVDICSSRCSERLFGEGEYRYGKTKKTSHPITVRLEQAIYDRLNQFVEDSGQPKTVALTRALTMYMDDYYERQRLLEEAVEKKS